MSTTETTCTDTETFCDWQCTHSRMTNRRRGGATRGVRPSCDAALARASVMSKVVGKVGLGGSSYYKHSCTVGILYASQTVEVGEGKIVQSWITRVIRKTHFYSPPTRSAVTLPAGKHAWLLVLAGRRALCNERVFSRCRKVVVCLALHDSLKRGSSPCHPEPGARLPGARAGRARNYGTDRAERRRGRASGSTSRRQNTP